MGQAIVVRRDFTAGEVRRFCQAGEGWRAGAPTAGHCSGTRRRGRCSQIGGMDHQTLPDWLVRFNEQGPDSLINIPSPGVPLKLGKKHRPFWSGSWRKTRAQRCTAVRWPCLSRAFCL